MSDETTGENTPVCWYKQEAAAAKGLLFKHGHLAAAAADEYTSPPSIAEDYSSIAEGVKRLASEAAAVETDWCHCDFLGRQVNYRGEKICSGCFKLARD